VSYGEIWWFFRDSGEASLDDAVTALSGAGVVLGNPATGVPQVIDADGQQVRWNGIEVKDRWIGGETVTAQFWVNPETDVLVELVHRRQLLTFDLDGMTTAEARLTVFGVLNAAFTLAGTQAVVVDLGLPDRGDDLCGAMFGGSSRAGLPFTPDLLATAEGDGGYRIDIRAGSWLSKPAATVQSFV